MTEKTTKKTTGNAGKGGTAKKTSSAKSTRKPRKSSKKTGPSRMARIWRVLRWPVRILGGLLVLNVLAALFYLAVNPRMTPYMISETHRLGQLDHEWVRLEDIAPVMARSAVAAEDANFCNHWGFDGAALRDALSGGARRGGSTISQQVVKNVYLWQGRSWIRKGLEAMMTPVVELIWSKERILEVYLNVAEFDEGVFGVEAASVHYFGVNAADLSARQAARLVTVLPDPKGRSASEPSDWQRRRAGSVSDGAALIRNDGRAGCFAP
ncbi:monofunctional biosynthetic peptidoglycan transglycosylase [Halocynthiibacter sp.]|uniref:monofunctional biosynthetic peptidoglycan transglycosylase n=1 Tax=Halocynthiibacter sp. TaxID=1979210 RepID=UPI003C4A9B7B